MALSTTDEVRLQIGDRDVTTPLFTDAELQYFLDAVAGNVLMACSFACDALATRFAAGIDFTTDTMAVKKFQRAEMMTKQADRFRERAEGVASTVQTKVDGYSQDTDNLDTNLLPLNIDPDVPRYGPGWEMELQRQQGDNYIPGQ